MWKEPCCCGFFQTLFWPSVELFGGGNGQCLWCKSTLYAHSKSVHLKRLNIKAEHLVFLLLKEEVKEIIAILWPPWLITLKFQKQDFLDTVNETIWREDNNMLSPPKLSLLTEFAVIISGFYSYKSDLYCICIQQHVCMHMFLVQLNVTCKRLGIIYLVQNSLNEETKLYFLKIKLVFTAAFFKI